MRKFPILQVFSAAVLAVVVFAMHVAARAGLLLQFLLLFLLAGACLGLVTKAHGWWRGTLRRMAFSRSQQPWKQAALWQAALRWAVWITVGTCLQSAVRPVQFSPSEFTNLVVLIWLLVILLCMLSLYSSRQISLVPNVFFAIVLLSMIRHLVPIHFPTQPGRAVVLAPPVAGRWAVLQGGSSALINHHFYVPAQQYALDLIKPEDGRLEGKHRLEDFASFGQSVYAPIEGRVVAMRDGLADQSPGSLDRQNPWGNHVVIEAGADTYVMLAHLQKDSLVLQAGDQVQVGQRIGRCGNSGRSSQPHLHIHAMDHAQSDTKENRGLLLRFLDQGTDLPRRLQANDVLHGRAEPDAQSASYSDVSSRRPAGDASSRRTIPPEGESSTR